MCSCAPCRNVGATPKWICFAFYCSECLKHHHWQLFLSRGLLTKLIKLANTTAQPKRTRLIFTSCVAMILFSMSRSVKTNQLWHETSHNNVCRWRWVTGSWSKERDTAVALSTTSQVPCSSITFKTRQTPRRLTSAKLGNSHQNNLDGQIALPGQGKKCTVDFGAELSL